MSDGDKSSDHGTPRRKLSQYLEERAGTLNWWWVIPLLCFIGVVGILIYVSQVPSGVRWSVYGTAVTIGSAAFLTGGLIGFLFGIPHTVQGVDPSTSGTQYRGNTNLEQVSDWLTKIIVGVGLVQIGRAIPALNKLAESLRAPLGGQASSAAFGLGLTISYALLGFFYLYLWSRTLFRRELDRNSTGPTEGQKGTGQTDQYAKQMIDANEDIQRGCRPIGATLNRWGRRARR